MKLARCNALVGAAIALTAVATTVPARADAVAQSILVIDNPRLRHVNGTPYIAGDFTTRSAGSVGAVGAAQNGVFTNVLPSGATDIIQQMVGTMPARPVTSFTPFVWPGEGADFGAADDHMSGAMITAVGTAGALIRHRADASLTAPGAAMGNSGMAGATTFTFELGADQVMTISLNAFDFTQAYVASAKDDSIGASALLASSISVLDLTTGATVFTFAPDQLNALSNVSGTNGLDGAITYECATSCSRC